MNKNKYVDIFVREAEEHLQKLRQGLLTLEKDGLDEERLNDLLRRLHTLKGSAKMVDLVELSGVAHRLEDQLKDLQNGQKELSTDLIDVLLVATDAIEALLAQAHAGGGISVNIDPVVEALKTGKVPPEQPAENDPAGYAGPERRKSVRTSIERLDLLVNRASEIILNHQTLDRHEQQLRQLLRQLDQLHIRQQEDDNQQDTKLLRDTLQNLIGDFEQKRVLFGYQSEELYQSAMELRLLPLATITDDFEHALRGLARNLNKEVRLIVKGQNVELDRTMLDAIKPILLHVLNNAVDHGIEEADLRLQLGKPKAGQIERTAHHEGSFVQSSIRDDGQGMDPAKIRATAVKRQMMTAEEAAALSDEATLYLVFEPGFSTREFITDVSGRGVGLDVVKTNLDRVKGDLSMRCVIGEGTELLLRLPLSLAVFTGMLVACGQEHYVFPQHYLSEILRISPQDIHEEMGREVVRYRERSIPLITLAQALGTKRTDRLGNRLTVLILSFREQEMALLVGKALGLQDIVVKGLGSQLKSLTFFSGATIMPDGTPAMILSVADLFVAFQTQKSTQLREAYAKQEEQKMRGRILVVDDSITTRTMEKNILETHGYDVTIAVSGIEALEKLEKNRYDLMVSDVEMPGMSGFELTRKVREREETAGMPVIIVTSLASDEHRRKGIEVGAQAYIVKGNFEQGTLLEAVETLIA